jgi:tetratricopeptide (TPR) repeat protein
MSLLWHQIKKDVLRLRWLLGLWSILIVLQAALLATSAFVSRGWALHLAYKLVAMLLPLLQILAMVVIVPLLVHEEPLVGTTAAWFTRPLSRRMLLASKTSFILAALVVAPLAAELVALKVNDARPSELALAAAEIALTQCGLVAALAALAALTPNFARFMTWGAAVWIVHTLAASGLMIRSMLGGAEGLLALADRAALRTSMVVSLGSALVAGAAVVAHQYLTRRTRRSVVIAVCGLVASFLLSMDWTWKRPLRPAAPTGRGVVQLWVDPESVSSMDAFSLQTLAHPRKKVSARVDCVRTPPNTFCEIDDLRGTLKYQDGSAVPVEQPRGPSLPRLHTASLERALGGPSIVNSGLLSADADLFEIDRAVYTQRGQTPAVLEGDGTVTLKRYRVVEALPLQRGAFHADGAERVTITDVLRGPGTCQVVLLQRKLRLLLSDRPDALPGFAATLFGPVSYVLVNTERKQAFVPEFVPSFNLGETLSQMMPAAQRVSHEAVSLMFTSESRFEKRPRLDDAWLDGASLVLVEADVQGRAAAHFSVPDFVLARSEMESAHVRPPELEGGLTPAQYYERGVAFLEDGLGHPIDGHHALLAAKLHLTKAVQGDPDLTAGYAGLALVAAANRDAPGSPRATAKSWLEKAQPAGPSDPVALRVEAYLVDAEQGDPAAVMERAVARSPGVAAYWRDLGYFRSKYYRLRKADEAYDRALETEPGPVEAARVHAQRAESYAQLRAGEARPAYEKAVALRPDFAPYWARLCQVRLDAGDCRAAGEAGRRARGLAASGTARSCLTRVALCLGHVDETAEEIKDAWGWDLVAIGDFFRDKGDETRARAYYQRARLNADDPVLAVSSSELERRHGGAAKAWPVLQPALAAYPLDPDVLAQAAVLQRTAGERKRALDLAAQALEARLDGKTRKRLDTAFGRDPDYARVRGRITERVEGLFDHYERKYDYQYLRRDLATTQWVIGHAGATHKDREAVPYVIPYLRESAFADTRAKAADALWYIGDRRAVPAMLAALSDPDLKVQGFAASGLGDLGDPAAVDPLLDLFVRLPDNRDETKARIADALGKLGDTRALPPIRDSLSKIKDPAYVRWARPAVARLEALPATPR